jgi:hypothetical protein
MDGFDEMCPFHIHKVVFVLSELMKTKVEIVLFTSRPVQKERLERKLSVFAVGMKKLSYGSEIKLFKDIWKSIAKRNEEECLNYYVRRLLKLANKSV